MNDQPPTLADDLLQRIETAEQERDQLRADLDAERKARHAADDDLYEIRHHLAKAISARQDAEQRLNDLDNRTRLLLVTPDGDKADDDTITVHELRTAIDGAWWVQQTEASGTGSSRRAQDDAVPPPGWGYVARVDQLLNLVESVDLLNISDGQAVRAAVNMVRAQAAKLTEAGVSLPPPPVPSQGQDIPDDQLDAIVAALPNPTGGLSSFARTLVRSAGQQAYRLGYAAALGYEIEITDGRVGVGDRPEPDDTDDPLTMADELRVHLRAVAAERDQLRAQAQADHEALGKLDHTLEQTTRDLLEARFELTQALAAEDEAKERAEELGTALTAAHRILKRLDALTGHGVALTPANGTQIAILGPPTEEAAKELGEMFAAMWASGSGQRVDAVHFEPAQLGQDAELVDVVELLAATRTALDAAATDADREEAVEELLEGWYAAWPETAVTSPHQAIAGELVRLLAPGPVTLTIPRELLEPSVVRPVLERPVNLVDRAPTTDLWTGLADRLAEQPLEPAVADEPEAPA